MNLGNTCYMNSIVQVLAQIPNFSNYFRSLDINLINKENKLLLELIYLLKDLNEKNESFSPDNFLIELQNYSKEKDLINFIGFDQNDASEFLLILIDYVYKTLERKVIINIKGDVVNEKDNLSRICFTNLRNMYSDHYCEILNICFGNSLTEIFYKETKLTCSAQSYCILNLPIPNVKSNITIIDCLNLYLEEENIEYFHNNQLKDCVKKTSFYNFPNVLIVSFNRFTHQIRKNHKIIYFPFENLDLNSYVKGYNSKNEFVYDLYAICNHSGSCMGGHYTSMIKLDKDKWYNFNDRIVSQITKNINDFYSKAYVLFYIKKKQ